MAEYLASEDLIDDESDLAAEKLARGTRLGRYELLLPIAKGGMARVWAARQHGQRGFTKIVAIKTILPHLARDAEFERMFLDEARIASMVHHPNVCEIYELGEEGRVLYLAMEWVNGESLAHVLRVSGQCQPLDPRVVARIVSETCAGLNAAHNLESDDGQALGVVHRDVSPHNILVSADGHVKVADFGVAKALGQSHSHTSAGQLKGKINYMAPEQVTGAPVDRRSDLFSLGCVLYEATTGVQPFKGEGDHQVMHRLLKGDAAAPSQLVPGYPPELEHIVMRALSTDPEDRYPSADRMRMALEEWLARGPVVTEMHIAGSVKARVGAILERRRERIRAAQSSVERVDIGNDPPLVEALTPSGRGGSGSGSGVIQAGTLGPTSRRPPVFPPPPSSGPLPGPTPSPVSARPGQLARTMPLGSAPPLPNKMGPPAPPPRPPSQNDWNVETAGYQPVFDAQIASARPPLPSFAPVDDRTGSHSHSRPVPAPVAAASPTAAEGSEPSHVALAAILGVVAIVAASAIGFFLWRARRPPMPDPTPIVATAAVAAPPIATPTAPPVDTAITVESVEPVMFVVTPETAILIVDGVAQAPGVRAVTRKPGQSVTVIVRAPEHEDAQVQVDDQLTNKTVVLKLTSLRRHAGPKRADPLPANPY
jgi:eukaryotic-like serine/threonine-protein kinase